MYRDDRDALLARTAALEGELARATGDRDDAVRRAEAAEAEATHLRKELAQVRPAPPGERRDRRRAWAIGAAAIAAVAVTGVVIAVAGGGGDAPSRDAPSRDAPSPTRTNARAAAVAPPIARQIPAYLAIAELYGGFVERMAETYPDRAVTTTPRWTTSIPTFKFYRHSTTSRHTLATLAASGTSRLDVGAADYLRHLELGLTLITGLQEYFRREDYRDDGGARWEAEDEAIHAWFAEHRRLRAALRDALAAAYPVEVTRAPDSLAHHLAAWEACSPIVLAIERGDPAEDAALREQIERCRAIPVRSIIDGIEHLGELCDHATFYRRETEADERAVARRRALSVGLFALQRMLSDWIGDLDLLPPPHGHI